MAEVEHQQIGPYPVTELLRTSSTSTYYRGKQRKKDILIKKLNMPLATNEAKEYFLLRAKQLKKLKHRHIINTLDAGFDGDYAYLVMEYSGQDTLRLRLTPGACNAPDEVKRILSPIADALNYAHTINILHVNLHPSNILLGERNDMFLTEFSLPALSPDEEAILYMAPEHLHGQSTFASDQYSLAAIIYELLCGRRPYPATTRELLQQQQQQGPISPLHTFNESVSPAVERVVLQALAYQPSERFAHTQEFADRYLSALMGFTVRSTPAPKPITTPLPAATLTPIHTPNPIPNPIASHPISHPIHVGLPVHPADLSAPAQSIHPAQPMHTTEPLVASHTSAEQLTPSLNGHAQPTSAPEQPASSQEHSVPSNNKQTQTPLPPQSPTEAPSIFSSRLQSTVTADLCQGGILSQRLPGYEERPAQVEMATLIARSLTQNVPAIVEASTGTGKALDIDTPIPTPTGWKSMGDLIVGDLVFDEQGQPTLVTAAFDIMHNRPCYEVIFSDGSSLIADAEHEWLTTASLPSQPISQPKHVGLPVHPADLSAPAQPISSSPTTSTLTPPTLITTSQMAATLTPGLASPSNHAIALPGPLTLPDTDLLISPYFLGVWLSDGDSNNNQIKTLDAAELIPEITKDGYTVRPLTYHNRYAVDNEHGKGQRSATMVHHLGALGVRHNKHIPTSYLRASEQQRRALLAGLLDTNGTIYADGIIEFTTIHAQLAQDAYELICSLGFSLSLPVDCSRHNAIERGSKWVFAFATDEQIFRLPHKIAEHQESLCNSIPEPDRFRYVIAINEVPSRPVRCIQVEAASHLYLAGRSMVPTHNSLAYLVPVVRSGKVAIVSTANKALQEQLFYKDIPFIQKHIKHFEAALVKGVNNYVCLDRVDSERIGMQMYTKNHDFRRLLDMISDPDPDLDFMGDFETLGFQLPGDVRGRIATDSDQCAWSKCSFFSECYVRQMRERAEVAQIIVVNHTLLLLDAAIDGHLLPERDLIILDEAHHLEEEATRSFTITINPNQIQTLLAQRLLKDHSQLNLQDDAMNAAQKMWIRLEQVADPGRKGRINLEAPLEEGLRLSTIISDLEDSLRKQRPKDMPEKETQLYEKLLKRTHNLSEGIRTVFSVADTRKFVYYVERVDGGSRGGFPLQASAAPLDVTALLKEKLFNKCNVICTSATRATVGTISDTRSHESPTC